MTVRMLWRLPVVILAVIACFGRVSAAQDETGFRPLFNGKNLAGWMFELSGASNDQTHTFVVKDGAIAISGYPIGYLYTDRDYKNYVIRYDWKFIRDGNAGMLLHIQLPHRVFPRTVEVQGAQFDHGRMFNIGGGPRGTFTVDREAQKKAIKVGDWNTSEVASSNGELVSKINGIEVSRGRSELTQGPIGFQSEGTDLLIKNIRIKDM